MTKEETCLIGEAIDFYNLNHFRGKETKQRLFSLKKLIEESTTPTFLGVGEHLNLNQIWKMAQKYNANDFLKIMEAISGK